MFQVDKRLASLSYQAALDALADSWAPSRSSPALWLWHKLHTFILATLRQIP